MSQLEPQIAPDEEPSTEGYRLSPQQRRLWGLQQRSRPSAHRLHARVRILGPLDATLLRRAVESVAARHEILRTTFERLPGMSMPVQVILDQALIGEDSQFFQVRQGAPAGTGGTPVESRQPPADESAPPHRDRALPLRSVLERLAPEDHVWQFELPALCADTPTLRNVVNEIARSYEALAAGSELEDEPQQYADLAAWLNELVESPDGKPGLDFWRGRDELLAEPLVLPFEERGGAEGVFAPKSIPLASDRLAALDLEAAADALDGTLDSLLLAAWHMLLYRLTGTADVVVHVAHTGRTHEELHGALGPLARYLPQPCHLEDRGSFRDVVADVRRTSEESALWQDYFTGDRPTDAAREPLRSHAPVLFDFDDHRRVSEGGGLSFVLEDDDACAEPFKLKLRCRQRRTGLAASIEYDPLVYSDALALQLAGHYVSLLESIASDPLATVSGLRILTDRERHQLLVELNETAAPLEDVCVHQLFERAAQRTPNATAVVHEDRTLTYAEVDQRANALAHHLQRLGVVPDALVAICVERSADLVIALLGTLKAGGAYVPLDPVLPAERLAFMLEDSGAAVLIIERRLTSVFDAKAPQVAFVDDVEAMVDDASRSAPVSAVKPENLAYVMYTSGSTGKPKGVGIEHQSLVNYITGIVSRLDLPVPCSFALVSTFAADLGNTVLFPSLCTGSTLHIVSPERVNDPDMLGGYFTRHAIDCLKIVPSHFAALLSSACPERVVPRKRLVLGGEALSWSLVDKVHALAPECVVFNHYGPTETTVGVTTWRVTADAPRLSTTVPIGRPIPNARVHVLDAQGEPVPLGVAGELYVGGVPVGRGYLHRPELTAEKFVPDRFSGRPGARLYRTGDAARYLPDGTLEFLGRLDQQVKVRGFRIELGEIEAVLREHAAVRDAVVTVQEGEAGEKRLVAYVVGRVAASELRTFVKERLPDYMVPGAFVEIAAVPLTPNGKVDRRALPAVAVSRPADRQYVAPRTPVEEVLAGIWAEVLRLERVGVEDNFFELGGDSILSIQIIARAHRAGLRLTPKQVFEHQTVAALATVVATEIPSGAVQGVVSGPVALTPIQHWWLEQQLPSPDHYNQALLLRVRPGVNARALTAAVTAVVAHHDALRLRVTQEASGTWQQANAASESAAMVTTVDVRGQTAAAQQATIAREAALAQTSLRLDTGPLMRVVLFDAGPREQSRLLLVIHHWAVDGVSWRILLEDLQTAYGQQQRGEAVALPAKTSAYQQWATALTTYAQSAPLAVERAYWLAPRPPVGTLPVDAPGGTNTVSSSRTARVTLTASETRALLQDVPGVYHTQVNDVLLTALVQALGAWTATDTVLIDLEGHGRDEELAPGLTLSRTVGWFTSIFPVCLTLPRGTPPGEALKRIKEQLRQIPRQGIGYGVLRYLSPDASIGSALQALPCPQVRFNYLGQFDMRFSETSFLAGVAAEPTGPGQHPAGMRPYLLAINSMVLDGVLQMDWTFSEAIHRPASVEAVAAQFVDALRALIAHCQTPDAGGFTPADFPRARLNQQALDQFISRISEAG